MEQEVYEGSDARQHEMRADTVGTADRLGILGPNGISADQLAVPRRIAVRIACDVDIGHRVRPNQVEEVPKALQHGSIEGFVALPGRGLARAQDIEDEIENSEEVHEGSGHHTSEMSSD